MKAKVQETIGKLKVKNLLLSVKLASEKRAYARSLMDNTLFHRVRKKAGKETEDVARLLDTQGAKKENN